MLVSPNCLDFSNHSQSSALFQGCGDGRYFQVNERISVVGVDICLELLKQTNISGKLCDVVAANNICLPFRSNCFDATISVNVIHHLATRERRLQSLSELARVLKPGGKLLVYVWALEQNHRGFSSQDVMVPWRNPPTEEGRIGRIGRIYELKN